LESVRHRGIPIVFLGLQENDAGLFSSSDWKKAPEKAIADLQGTPFFSMDVADAEPKDVDVMLKKAAAKNGEELSWMEARAMMSILDNSVAGVFAQARSMTDWNQRNKASWDVA